MRGLDPRIHRKKKSIRVAMKRPTCVPAARTKTGREYCIPLSKRALKIVKAMHKPRNGDFVFPGQKTGKPLSVMALQMVLRRMKVEGVTASAPPSATGRPNAPMRFARPRLPM
jgi:integrase